MLVHSRTELAAEIGLKILLRFTLTMNLNLSERLNNDATDRNYVRSSQVQEDHIKLLYN